MSFVFRNRKPGSGKRKLKVEPLEERRLLAVLTWTGAGADNNWGTAENWLNDETPREFDVPSLGDDLEFPDMAARKLNINNLAGLDLRSITIDGSGYDIDGEDVSVSVELLVNDRGGPIFDDDDVVKNRIALNHISGSGGLTKQGTGELTLANEGKNDYIGSTRVVQGTLILRSTYEVGTDDDGAIPGELIIGNGINADGTAKVERPNMPTVPGQIDDSAPVIVRSDGVLHIAAGNTNELIGSLEGDGVVDLAATLQVGGNGMDTEFSGLIIGMGSLDSTLMTIVTLVKQGPGTLTLSGNNTYTGLTRVTNGTLLVNGVQSASDVIVESFATLGGSGTTGTVTSEGGFIEPGGIEPGDTTGVLTVLGDISFGSDPSNSEIGTDFVVQLGGTDPGEFDQLHAVAPAPSPTPPPPPPSGAIQIGPESRLQVSFVDGYEPQPGDSFAIMKGSSISGTFADTPSGVPFFVGGVPFQIYYRPTDVVLVAIPSISVNDVTIVEGDQGLRDAVFTVSLSGPATNVAPVIAGVFVEDGTARINDDYREGPSGSVVFFTGESVKSFTVRIQGDLIPEPDETFFIRLVNVQNAVVEREVGEGTILNDDQFLVTGADAGGGPHVRVFHAGTGAVVHEFFAYDASFTGGVRVAVGDVNGDFVPDIITGAGPGGGPHVKVFSGINGRQLPGQIGSFFAYDASFTGGVYVAAGDVDGDGHADVATGADAGGGPHVRVFSGETGGQLPGQIGSFFAFKPDADAGVRVAVADVDGDGHADVITGMGPGYENDSERAGFNRVSQTQVRVFNGLYGTTKPKVKPFQMLTFEPFADEPLYRGGVHLAAQDVNGDSNAEIVVSKANGDGRVDQVFADLHLKGSFASDLKIFEVEGRLPTKEDPQHFFASKLKSAKTVYPGFNGSVRVAVIGDLLDAGSGNDIVTGAGPGGGPHIKALSSDDLLQVIDEFFAYDSSFIGGVFVAASVDSRPLSK